MSHDPINGTPQAEAPMSGVVDKQFAEDEAERLAKAQAERLAKKIASPLPEAPIEAPKPKVVASLAVQIFDNGQCTINVPHDDFDSTLEMIRLLQVTIIQRARQQGVEAEKAQKKIPFMKRLFNRQRSAI